MIDVKWDEVEAILAEDCALAGRYIDDEGQTCAIGALAQAAGVEMALFDGRQASTIRMFGEAQDAIYERFGLTQYHQVAIQEANDSVRYDGWRYLSDEDAHVARRQVVAAMISQLRAADDRAEAV